MSGSRRRLTLRRSSEVVNVRRSKPKSDRVQAALGIATHLGWASVVTIVPTSGWLRAVRIDRILTAATEDISAQAPYHHAAGYEGAKRIPVPADPSAVVERGRAEQRRHALANLRALVRDLDR